MSGSLWQSKTAQIMMARKKKKGGWLLGPDISNENIPVRSLGPSVKSNLLKPHLFQYDHQLVSRLCKIDFWGAGGQGIDRSQNYHCSLHKSKISILLILVLLRGDVSSPVSLLQWLPLHFTLNSPHQWFPILLKTNKNGLWGSEG